MLLGEGAPLTITRVPQGDARREHVLRDLIFDHPGLMPVAEFDPGYGRMITVAKELNIPGVGFIDVLLVDERGRLVIVECKLWRNPQARREVIGQALDYARELARFSYDDLQRQISISTRRRGNVLYDLVRDAGGELDEASFVDRVSRDLSAGRFLLLIVGDGITEGTRRIGEYLQAQPGLAFDFGLIEMAEYRFIDPASGEARSIMQPRLLAKTAVIERHVIRSEVVGVTLDAIARDLPLVATPRIAGPVAAAHLEWTRLVERLVSAPIFDDPGQPPPRRGGLNWMRVPLPGTVWINLWRSNGGVIGAAVRFAGSDGLVEYQALLDDRDAIDAEFTETGLSPPQWASEDEVKIIRLISASLTPLMVPLFSGHGFRPFVVRPVPGSCIRERNGSAGDCSSPRYTRTGRVAPPRGLPIDAGGQARP